MASKLAIGTYQIHGPLEHILIEAWKNSCFHIDTAPNYRGGMAQTDIYNALFLAREQGYIEEFSNN